jgi:TrmH family RNA methyltransferase
MFSVRKLERLPPKTRLRKLLVMIRDEEARLAAGGAPRDGDLRPLLRSEAFLSALGPARSEDAAALQPGLAGSREEAVRSLNAIRHLIMTALDVPWAEWDQLLPGATEQPTAPRRVFPMRVYLEDVRSPYNVGAIFRTAEAFGVEHVYLSPRTPLPTLARARRTSRGCSDVVSWSVCGLADIAPRTGGRGAGDLGGSDQAATGPVRLPVFALETGGIPIDDFPFPASGTVLVGSEELGLSPAALALAGSGAGRVSIPMAGARASLNVAVAFGILMQAWYSRLR